jgi:hypothetical protein
MKKYVFSEDVANKCITKKFEVVAETLQEAHAHLATAKLGSINKIPICTEEASYSDNLKRYWYIPWIVLAIGITMGFGIWKLIATAL